MEKPLSELPQNHVEKPLSEVLKNQVEKEQKLLSELAVLSSEFSFSPMDLMNPDKVVKKFSGVTTAIMQSLQASNELIQMLARKELERDVSNQH